MLLTVNYMIAENENSKLMDLVEKQHALLGRVVETLDRLDQRLKRIEEKNG